MFSISQRKKYAFSIEERTLLTTFYKCDASATMFFYEKIGL